MGGDPRRVARFDPAGPASGPAVEARFDAIGDGDGPAAPVAALARIGMAGDPAGPGPTADSGSAPDDQVAPLARLGEVGEPAPPVSVAELEVPGAAADAPARTARLGSGGRARPAPGGGRRGGSAAARPAPGERPVGSRAARRGEARTAPAADPVADAADSSAADQDAAPEAGRAAGARRGWGPKQIDPDADPLVAAREICLRLLTDRARTRHELSRALTQRGVPVDAAESVLSRFDEVGLIDDAAFAGQYVRSRHTYRGLSRRAIAMELRRKGVDDEVAGEALEEVDPASEEQRARELVDRKLRTVPADTPEQRRKAVNRLVGMLARKGYGGGIAYRVVREALAAHGADVEELGDDPAPD